jgi:hypothetical protein
MISLAPKAHVLSAVVSPLNQDDRPAPLDTCEKLGNAVFAALAGHLDGMIERPHAGAAPQAYVAALEKMAQGGEAFARLGSDGRKDALRELEQLRDRVPLAGLPDDVEGAMLACVDQTIALCGGRTMAPPRQDGAVTRPSLSTMSRYVLQEAILPFLESRDVLHLRGADRSMRARLADSHAGIELAARATRIGDIGAFRDLLELIARLPASLRGMPLIRMSDAVAGLAEEVRYEAFRLMLDATGCLPEAERPRLVAALDHHLGFLPRRKRAEGFHALLRVCIALPVKHQTCKGMFLLYANVSCLPPDSRAEAFGALLDAILRLPATERAAQLRVLATNLYSVDDDEMRAATFCRMMAAAGQLAEELRGSVLDTLNGQRKYLPDGFDLP